jgi:hypothetical protein
LLSSSRSISLVEDSDFFLDSLDPHLFPGISSSVQVHNGFRDSQARSAVAVLAAVRSVLAKKGTSNVTVVGHSLGAAIALIDSLYLSLQLGPSVNVRTIGYGMPRVSVFSLGGRLLAALTEERRRATRRSRRSSTKCFTSRTSTTRRTLYPSSRVVSSASTTRPARSTSRPTIHGSAARAKTTPVRTARPR